MIRVKKIAHAIYEMPDVDKQTEYYTEVLGLTVTGKDKDAVYLASTVDHHSVVLRKGSKSKCARLGFQIAPEDDLGAFEKQVQGLGIKTERQKDPEPSISDMVTFQDPKGTVMEVFKREAFSGQRFPTKGIVPHKLGHVAFFVTDVKNTTKFYVDVLGFRLSDFTLRPFKAYFFHINARHHSLALIETGRNGMHHLMVELFSLDDVGQGYDLAQVEPSSVRVTLGRHTNDLMTSFYAESPGGFLVECGWGGREIDVDAWQPCEYTIGPSLWGHDRAWLSPEKRDEARALRLRAAAEGRREPVQVLPGNFRLMPGTCPWWDELMRAAE